MKFFNNNNNKQFGFTMLIAALIASLLLTLGIAIANLTIKQYTLSTTTRESHKAFYSADAAIECALFWDRENPNSSQTAFGSEGSLTCDGVNNVNIQGTGPWTFSLDTPDVCANVTVTKGGGETVIESRGYNLCDSSPRRVERALRATY